MTLKSEKCKLQNKLQNLMSRDLEDRVHILEEAVFGEDALNPGRPAPPSGRTRKRPVVRVEIPGRETLPYRKGEEGRGGGRGKAPPRETHVPFPLKKPHGNTSASLVPSVVVCETHYELSWADVGTDGDGRVARFVHKFGVDDLAMIRFDRKTRAADVHRMLMGKVR